MEWSRARGPADLEQRVSQPNPPSSDKLVGQVLADRYHILSVLGEGGMGRVYLAEHVRMGRKSAVKVMSPNMALSAEAISRFNREAANASRINHPNVAQIYDFGETSAGLLYLAMEYVEGETLRSLIHRGGPLAIPRAAELTRQIADALSAAHHLGIVHRDLKPDNILLTRRHDGADSVKVVDFGIAKTVQGSGGDNAGGQTVTTAGVSLGTPEYMSPEQLAGERLDARTDLYSLGLVLFNMLTANLPYPRVTSKETLVRRLTSRPLTLREVVPGGSWPVALQSALDRALAPEPVDRFTNVTDFGRAVVDAVNATDARGAANAVAFHPTSGPTERIPTPAPRRGSARPMSSSTRRRSLVFAGGLLVFVAAGAGAFVAMRARAATLSAAPVAKSPVVAAAPATIPTSIDSSPPAAAQTAQPTTVSPAADSARKPKQPAAQDSHVVAPVRADTVRHEPAKPAALVQPKQLAATSQSGAASQSAVVPGDTAIAMTLPPVNPVDTTPENREKTMAKFRHPMLRATGDTSAASAMPTTDPDRIRVLGEDIQGHLQRARQFVQQGDIFKARGEFRDMAPVVLVLRQLYAGSPDETRVEQMLRAGVNQTVSACRTAIQDSTTRAKLAANFRCEQLVPQGVRGQRGGRGSSPQPWNR
jgi:serine/threonine-protein kinase